MSVLEKLTDAAFFPQLTDMQFLLLLSKSLEKTMLVLTSEFVYRFLIIVPYFHLTKFKPFLKIQFSFHPDHEVPLNYYHVTYLALELQVRRQKTSSVSGFVGHAASAATSQSYHCSMKAATDNT